MSIAVFSLWVGNLTLTQFFPYMDKGMGFAETFWVNAFVYIVGFALLFRLLAEACGKTLEQIERQLGD